MNKVLLAGTLAFAAGIYCLIQFSTLPAVWLLWCLPLVTVITWQFPVFRPILLFFIGFCWALFRADAGLKHTIPREIEQQQLLLTGVVASVPEIYPDHIRFQLQINEIKDENGKSWNFQGITRLSWYKHQRTPVPGEVWQLRAKLKQPWSFMNPGGFDYEAWLFRQGVASLGYVKDDASNKLLEVSSKYYLQNVRYKIARRLKKIVPEKNYGLSLALGLGDRSQLSPYQINILTRTGTNHLIAISGLHLGLIASLFYFLARFFWSRFYFATQLLPAPVFAAGTAFVFAFMYAALTGFALPAQRALIMIGVLLWALLSGRQIIISHVIAAAIFLVLLFDPFAIIAADFWLSFAAVCFIFYVTRFRITKQNSIFKWFRLQFFLSLALCPLLIFWFNQVPLYSLLANSLAIPVVGLVIVPLLLMAMLLMFLFPGLSIFIYNLISFVSDKQWQYLEFIARQNYGVIPIASPTLFSMFSGLIGVLILLMPKGLPGRWLGIVWFLPLIFPIISKPANSEFNFTLLDVGQGLAAVIETNKHVLVYDTGARFSDRFNIGDAVLTPFMKHYGINTISTLIVSHGDNDHIGGAHALLNNFHVKKIMTSIPERFIFERVEHCQTGQEWYWDGVTFEILHPDLNSSFIGNNSSCVLKVSGRYGSVLLAGDIEKQAEAELLKQTSDKLKSDILVVPHHGSRTSSTIGFIDAVSPKFAFFPVGYKNRFGFPKKDILSRYETRNIETRVSYQTGALLVRFRKNGLQINEFRRNNQRFWHHHEVSRPVSE